MPNNLDSLEFIPEPVAASAATIDIASLFRICASRWKLITAALFFTLLATYGILRIVPLGYKSSVEVLIFDPDRQVDQDIQKTVFPFRENVDAVAMDTEIEVIKSRSLALRVAERLGLDEDQQFLSSGSLVSGWIKKLGTTGSEVGTNDPAKDVGQAKTLRLDRAANAVQANLKAERLGNSYVMTITATSRDPAMAQRLATTAAAEFLSSQRESREDALQRVLTWLKSRLEDLQGRINEAQASIKKLRATMGLGDDVADKGKITDQQINDLTTQIMLAKSDVADKQAHLDQAHRVLESGGDLEAIPEVRTSGSISQLQLQASQLNWQEARLRSQLGPNHEAVIAVHNQLLAVNKTINEEAVRVVGDLKNAYDIAVQREQSLEANLQSLTNGHGSAGDFSKLQELLRLVDADQKLYQGYLAQSNELSTNGALPGQSARIISGADLPTAPSSPRRLLFYGLGGVFGLFAGLSAAFLLEYLRRGLMTGEEALRVLGYPVLGVIPMVRLGRRRDRSGPPSLVQSMVDAPLSEFGEAVRTTRLGLQFSDREQSPKVILVTSAVPGEGKSTSAMLLSASSVTSGQRTILVDCDLRHQSLSQAFGMPQRGLVDVLMGRTDLAEVTIRDPATGVHVIPAGAGGTGLAGVVDLLTSQRMRDLIANLRNHFDYVVLDASPVLPVADVLGITTMVDKVLVVVEWDRTPRDAVLEAFKVLRPEAHRIAGIVLNKVGPKGLPGYGYGYGYR